MSVINLEPRLASELIYNMSRGKAEGRVTHTSSERQFVIKEPYRTNFASDKRSINRAFSRAAFTISLAHPTSFKCTGNPRVHQGYYVQLEGSMIVYVMAQERDTVAESLPAVVIFYRVLSIII